MNYSIITPTKNEGKFIEETIRSMISQDVLPVEWFIMDDDSTDDTSQIINRYLDAYPFIKYIKLSGYRKELTNTGGRVAAIINYADSLRSRPTDLVAKVDADISFEKNFFSLLIKEFKNDERLGVASGHLVENGVPEPLPTRIGGRGATVVFRYKCFTEIGKFYESKTRGEDQLAYVAARALGWKAWTFDIYFNHLKPEGIRSSKLKNHYVTGAYKGSIPYWFLFFCGNIVRDAFKKPYLIGSVVQLYAYCSTRYISRYKPFPEFVSRYYRQEQKEKFKKMIGL